MAEEDSSILSRRANAPDEVVAYGQGSDQNAEVRSPGVSAAARPLLIVLHGGFWRSHIDRSHARPMAQALAAAGWTVALPEYARVEGTPAPTLADLALALQKLPALVRQHDSRVLLVGHSAGGHLALWAAAAAVCPALHAVLALAPAADLRLAHELNLSDGAVRGFLGREPSARPDVDPRQMPAPGVPVTLIQGQEDAIVPPAIAESYVTAHPGVRLVRLAATGHYSLIDPWGPAWPTVIAELERLCARGTGSHGTER